MKFLPAVEFEKRQKSLNQNQLPAIMSSTSIIKKIGFLVDCSSPTSSYLSSTDRGLPRRIELIRTKERHQMLLKLRRKQMTWKKKETMLLRKRSMKKRRTFILKLFNWTRIRDHSGQIVQHVEIQWKNTKMLWLTVYPHYQLTRRILRMVFKLYFISVLTVSWWMTYYNWFSLKPKPRQLFKKETHFWVWVDLMKPKSATSHCVNLEKILLPTRIWKSFMISRKKI